MGGGTNKPALFVDGKRLDGRAVDELRPIKIKASVLHRANGSCYLEWGENKIMAAVFGPRECIPRHKIDPYSAVINCRYRMSPFASLEEHSRAGPSRRSTELSKVIREVFENVVIGSKYPKTAIDISVEVLQADGGTRCAAITAASIALADAGIPMRDLVCAVAVGKIDGKLAIDFSKIEDNHGNADIPIAVSSRNKEILLLQMDGLMTKDEMDQAMDMAINASDKIHALQVEALKEVYAKKAVDNPEEQIA
ncbi:MAG: exosome complex exonuclease Rrp41 [Candidatus Micrarchaeota archaeon]